MKRKIILASASPRRLELLYPLGFEIIVLAPEVDETPLENENPKAHVKRLSKLKSNAVKKKKMNTEILNPNIPVIAADTIVCLGNSIIGKPKNFDEAVRTLSLLSGKEHNVFTGFTVRKGKKQKTGVVNTKVLFRHLTKEQIITYVETEESLDKAGSYGIQGTGASLIDKIKGSYTNVIGLPIKEVLESLSLVDETFEKS